jgi:redox-sensitive bicupin YhaK (pirin superfamily)
VHLYQIWLFPIRKGIEPSYEQKRFAEEERRNRLQLVASHDAAEGSLLIHQDVQIYLSTLDDGQQVTHSLDDGRHAWLQVLRGSVSLNGQDLKAGDGAAISDERLVVMQANGTAEVMLFDLA